VLKRSKLFAGWCGRPAEATLIQTQNQNERFKNFDSVNRRIQDELWKMNTKKREQEEAYEYSFVLSSRQKRLQTTISARRKMWGEDGNDARRIKLSP
jgi:hypothetical protein